MKNYKRLLQYIRPYLKRLGLAIVCIVVAAACNLYLPWIIKDMVDKVLADKDMVMLYVICVSIVVVFLIRGIFYYGQSYLVSYIGQKVVIDVREVMFRKFQRMPMAYFDKHQTGETMSYITNDVSAIQSALVDQLIEMVTESSILIGSIAMMLYLDWKLSLLTLVVIPLVGQAMKIFGRKLKRNGTLIYTIRPMEEALRFSYERQMQELSDARERQKIKQKLSEFDRKREQTAQGR